MVEPGSNYRWCQRFMREVSFEEDVIGQVIPRLLSQGKLTLCIDRTEWEWSGLAG